MSNVNVAMCARDQSSICNTGGKFRSDHGLLLELHTLTLVDRSYALLLNLMMFSSFFFFALGIIENNGLV